MREAEVEVEERGTKTHQSTRKSLASSNGRLWHCIIRGWACDSATVLPDEQSKIGCIWGWEEDGEEENDPYGRMHKGIP